MCEPLMKFGETAEFLNMSESGLRKLVFAGEVPVLKLGRELRFDRDELIHWMKRDRPANLRSRSAHAAGSPR